MRLPALKISYKVLILVAIPLLFEIGLVCFISVLISDSDQAMERELLSKEIILRAGMVARDAAQGAFSVGTYYYTQSDFFKEHYLNDRKSLQENVNAEERLLLKANKKDQLERLKNIRRLSTDGIEMMDEVMNDTDLRKKGQTGFISQNSLVAIVKSSRIMHALLTETQFVMRNESVYRDQYESITRKAKERIRLAVWALLLSLIMAAALAFPLLASINKRLQLVMQNTRKVPKGEALAPRLKGGDEIAELDAVFHDMVDELYNAQKMKQYLLSMVSHDIRSPLTSVQGLLTLLSVGTLGELNSKGKQRVTATEAELERLIRLTSDLLDVERLSSGTLQMEIKTMPSSVIVATAVSALETLAEQCCVKLEKELLNLDIKGDKERLVQVMVNLLSNAIKYSPKNGVIKISVERDGDMALFKVRDQGRGIPPEFQARIFERFQQVEASDASEKGGKGLGLAICKSIVEAHAGSIGVTSKQDQGSTFWFTVPLSEGKET